MPRLARGNGYDIVIRHLAVGRVSFGGILEDSTYTFCQMSYDVGHDLSIVSQTGSWPNGSPPAIRPAACHEEAAGGSIPPRVPSAGSQGRGTSEGPRPEGHRAEMAGGLGEGPRVRREGRSGPPEMVLDRPLSVHEWIPAPRVRDLVPAGGVPVAVPPDARLQRPPSAGVPLHGPPHPRRREAC